MAVAMHKLDEVDRSIMNTIRKQRDLWTPSKLAGLLPQPQSTLEKRVKLLREHELLQDVTTVDLAALGYTLRYRIDVKINPEHLRPRLGEKKGKTAPEADAPLAGENPQQWLARRLQEQLAGYQNVIMDDITILMGSADLCLRVRAKTHEDVFELITQGLRLMPAVADTITSHEAWSIWDKESRPSATGAPSPG